MACFSEHPPSPLRRAGRAALLLALAGALLPAAGCSAEKYRKDADKETYGILTKKTEKVLGAEEAAKPFSIEPNRRDPLDGLRAACETVDTDALDSDAARREERLRVPLIVALRAAAAHSRAYQSQKEQLYLSALGLTLERYQFQPQLASSISTAWSRNSDHSQDVSATGEFGVTRALATGGQIGINFTTSVFRYLVGGPHKTQYDSGIVLSFVQPLWRGAGQRIAQESLTQAERNAIYAVRRFARYQQTFAVDIATSYYNILLQEEVVRNEGSNYDRVAKSRQRVEAEADAGKRPVFEVDQARQQELSARDRYVRARQQLGDALDDFKVDLGLPLSAPITLDSREVAALRATGMTPPDLTTEAAIETAMRLRFDFLTTADQVTDAERRVVVARDNLGPDLDVALGASVNSPANKPVKFNPADGALSAEVALDLPLNRKAQRNAYRGALIAVEQSRRDYTLAEDNLRRDVRQLWRRLEQARQSYAIQQLSATLAARRVESVNLLLGFGRATTRDLLDAQSDLLSAQNALTGALVDYHIALLQFWRDTGLLRFDDNGISRASPNETRN